MITAALLLALALFALLAAGPGWNNVLSPARNDLVFADRNRAYGAYVIRREHHRTMLLATVLGLGIVSSVVLLPRLFMDPGVVVRPLPKASDPGTDIFLPPPPEVVRTVTPPSPTPPPRPSIIPGGEFVARDLDSTITAPDTATASVPGPVGPVGPEPGPGPVTPTGGGSPEPPSGDGTTYADEAPEYPGGLEALYAEVGRKTKYPEIDVQAQREGRVMLAFIVDVDGSVSDVIVTRGVSPTIDAEAIRVFKQLKRWKPGKAKGQPVRTWYTIPIRFMLK